VVVSPAARAASSGEEDRAVGGASHLDGGADEVGDAGDAEGQRVAVFGVALELEAVVAGHEDAHQHQRPGVGGILEPGLERADGVRAVDLDLDLFLAALGAAAELDLARAAHEALVHQARLA
jgi:hypothetical protein